jgi:O-glycosyl hydrolase
MNKTKLVVFRTLVMAAAFLMVMSACELGYTGGEIVDAATPKLDSQSQSIGVDVNTPVTFTVAASLEEGAKGELSYQWYQYLTYRAYADQAGIKLEGQIGTTYSPPTNQDGIFNYYVVVTNTNNSATGRKMSAVKSEAIVLTVNNPNNAVYPVITSQPTVTGDLIWGPRMALPVLEVAAEVKGESDEILYQWYVTDKLTNTQGTAIKGATASRLIPPVFVEGTEDSEGLINGPGDYYYFAIVTNYCFSVAGRRNSSVASSPVLVSVGVNPNADIPVIRSQPQNAIYFSGDTVTALTVAADTPEDGGTISYEWYSNATSSTEGGTKIAGAAAAAYTPPIDTATPQKYYYYAIVTNTNSAATNPISTTASRVAEVTVTNPAARAANATFTVQFGGTNQLQFVRGFGGMDVAWGNFPNYNHPSLPSPLNISDDYENMYNPDILGYNMLRIMILPTNTDISKTLSDLVSNQIYTTMDRTRFYENIKTVNGYGGYVLASPWSPPAAWKTNNSINGGGSLRASDFQNFANYLRAFAQNMLNNGAPIYAISISNEPNYTAGYDGCEWASTEMRDFYYKVGRFTEGVAGFGGGKMIESVKTMNGESANDVSINQSAYALAGARNNIDLFGRHNYGVRESNGANIPFGSNKTQLNWIYNNNNPREIWMTEHNLNSNSGTTYPNDHTWNYVWLFMNDVDMTIRINHEAAFIWWSSKRFYSMIGDGTYGSRDGEILPRGWGLAHYAKFAKETYRVSVAYEGTTKDGAALVEGETINGSRYEDFTSQTVKVSAFMKLRGEKEPFPVNWRNKEVPISDIEEITMVMYTPTESSLAGSGGYDMGTVKIQLPEGFKISSATAMRSDPVIFNRGGSERGTPQWETVDITADRNAAFVDLPVSTILSVRFTQ